MKINNKSSAGKNSLTRKYNKAKYDVNYDLIFKKKEIKNGTANSKRS